VNTPSPALSYPREEIPLAVVSDGRWHHIAAVFDGSIKAVYVDGRLDLSQAVTVVDAAALAAGNATAGFILRDAAEGVLEAYASVAHGGGSLALGSMSGYIDGVRVWNTAWSGRELQARAAAFAVAATPAAAALALASRGAGAGKPPAAAALLFEESFDALPGGREYTRPPFQLNLSRFGHTSPCPPV
jgi:hypothetical protein